MLNENKGWIASPPVFSNSLNVTNMFLSDWHESLMWLNIKIRAAGPKRSSRQRQGKVQRRERRQGWKPPESSPHHPPPGARLLSDRTCFFESGTYLLRTCDHGCVCQETCTQLLWLWVKETFWQVSPQRPNLMTRKRERGCWERQSLTATGLWSHSDCPEPGCTSGTEEWNRSCILYNLNGKNWTNVNLRMAKKRASLIGIGGNQVARVRPTKSRKL